MVSPSSSLFSIPENRPSSGTVQGICSAALCLLPSGRLDVQKGRNHNSKTFVAVNRSLPSRFFGIQKNVVFVY